MKDVQKLVGDLKTKMPENGFLDVGRGVEQALGVSPVQFRSALSVLRESGYEVHRVPVTQAGTDKVTVLKLLGPADSTWAQAREAVDQQAVAKVTD